MHSEPFFETLVDRIQVWTLSTQAGPEALAASLEILSGEEKDRAERFRHARSRETFILTRAVVRMLLGRRLECDPRAVSIRYGANGKPALGEERNLYFNVTHSDGLAAIAMTSAVDIGIDLEKVRPFPDLEQIADASFSPEETQEINSLSRAKRQRAFFSSWTRREAYLKAVGIGLSDSMNQFRVKSDSNGRKTLEFLNEIAAAQTWTIEDLELLPGFVGAVAFRHEQLPVSIIPVTSAFDIFKEG
jgi:4'-phosphopantetheinyl transferase